MDECIKINRDIHIYTAQQQGRERWEITAVLLLLRGEEMNDLSQNQAVVGSFASALYLFSRHRCLNITARIEVYLSRFFYRMG